MIVKKLMIPLMLAFAGIAAAPAQPSMVALPLHPSWAVPSARIARVRPDEQVSIEIVLPWRDPATVKKLANEISDPRSPMYEHYLTSPEFRARFAPTDQTVSTVTAWLRASGLEVGKIPANRIIIPARGSASTIEKMFNTTLSRYRVLHGAFALRAPDSAPSVPSDIASLGALVRGLDESSSLITTGGPLAPDMLENGPPPNIPETPASPADVAPPAAAQYAAPCSSYDGQVIVKQAPMYQGAHQPAVTCSLSPQTLRETYAHDAVIHKLRTHNVDGAGQTIVMIGSHEIRSLPTDIETWSERNHIPALQSGQFREFSYPGAYQTPNDPTGAVLRPAVWAVQAAMLFETMRSIAPGASYLYVGSTSSLDLQDAMLLAVDQHFGDVIVNGWYSADEAGVLPSDMAPIDEAGQEAAMTGISLLFASGDLGDNAHFNATDTYGTVGSTAPVKDIIVTPGHPSVSFPADNSMVTAVGATSLITGRGGSYTRELCWAKTYRPISSDGKSWGNPISGNYRGSGGGRSLLYDQPQYQAGVVPTDLALRDDGSLGRTVPDISVNGDAETGMSIGYTMTFPDGSAHYAERRVDADTAATALFGAVIALANQNDDVPLGFVNPLLYLLNYRDASLRDINLFGHPKAGIRTEYVNGVDSSKGITRTLKTFEQFGTNTPREGYDTCTGLGSVGPNFLAAMERHTAG
ncbi:MAG: S53 family peptidase [Actinomycetota bacterium]